jgi:hypothetical protein
MILALIDRRLALEPQPWISPAQWREIRAIQVG